MSLSKSLAVLAMQLHYTLDQTTPNETSPVYSGPILVTGYVINLQAIAVKSGLIDSDIASALYFFASDEQVATPTFNPEPGTYFSPISVSIFCDTVN